MSHVSVCVCAHVCACANGQYSPPTGTSVHNRPFSPTRLNNDGTQNDASWWRPSAKSRRRKTRKGQRTNELDHGSVACSERQGGKERGRAYTPPPQKGPPPTTQKKYAVEIRPACPGVRGGPRTSPYLPGRGLPWSPANALQTPFPPTVAHIHPSGSHLTRTPWRRSTSRPPRFFLTVALSTVSVYSWHPTLQHQRRTLQPTVSDN